LNTGRHVNQVNPMPDKYVQYSKSAALSFGKKFRTFDRQQPIRCEARATQSFADGDQSGVVLAWRQTLQG
jgi:hypothetical protein